MSGSFLTGEKVHLQIPDGRHLDLLYEWYNDDVATRLMFTGTFPIDRDTATKNFLDMVYSLNDVVLGIFARESADTSIYWFVGTIGLHAINWVVGSAEFRIFIGNTTFWGKGLGTEATQLISAYPDTAKFSKKIAYPLNTNTIQLKYSIHRIADTYYLLIPETIAQLAPRTACRLRYALPLLLSTTF